MNESEGAGPMVDLNTLVILNEVIRHKSFTKASVVLGMPSSNVSRKIQILEEALKMPLLYRTTRSVTPTQEGIKLVELAKGALDSHDQLQLWLEQRGKEPQGKLTMTAPESFVQWPLSDWLIEFKQAYPKVDIEILSDSHSLNFDEYRLDFAFRFGSLSDSSLIVKPLARIPFGFFTQRRQPSEEYDLDAVLQGPMISCLSEHGVLPWLYRIAGKECVMVPKPGFAAKDQRIALKACQRGVGVAFLPVPMVALLDDEDQLQPIIRDHWPGPLPLSLLYRDKSERQSLRHKAWLDFLANKLPL